MKALVVKLTGDAKSKFELDLPTNIMYLPNLRSFSVLLVVEHDFKVVWHSALGDKSTGQACKKYISLKSSDRF